MRTVIGTPPSLSANSALSRLAVPFTPISLPARSTRSASGTLLPISAKPGWIAPCSPPSTAEILPDVPGPVRPVSPLHPARAAISRFAQAPRGAIGTPIMAHVTLILHVARNTSLNVWRVRIAHGMETSAPAAMARPPGVSHTLTIPHAPMMRPASGMSLTAAPNHRLERIALL